jgi:hypothetical protein
MTRTGVFNVSYRQVFYTPLSSNNCTHACTIPPRSGFSMELGAVLTVLIATYLAIPVSTTHCITGATFAVGLCNGDTKVCATDQPQTMGKYQPLSRPSWTCKD